MREQKVNKVRSAMDADVWFLSQMALLVGQAEIEVEIGSNVALRKKFDKVEQMAWNLREAYALKEDGAPLSKVLRKLINIQILHAEIARAFGVN